MTADPQQLRGHSTTKRLRDSDASTPSHDRPPAEKGQHRMNEQQTQTTDDTQPGWLTCYVPGCDEPVKQQLRLHVPKHETQEVLACEGHARVLRMLSV